MEQALTLYAFLILSIMSISSPILVLLLSVFSAGTSLVKEESENQKTKAEDNLKDSIENKDEIDEKIIDQRLKELKVIKRIAVRNLFYLDPKKQILLIFLPLLISFILILLSSIFISSPMIFYSLIILSVFLFLYVLLPLWRVFSLVVKVRKAQHTKEIENQKKVIEILNSLKKQSKSVPFLKKIVINIDGANIKKLKDPIEWEVHKERSTEIAFINSENKMIKTTELGFAFPLDFIIPSSTKFSIWISDSEQNIRFEESNIQASTRVLYEDILITPIKIGKYEIRVWAKAENLETYKSTFEIYVV